MSVLGMRVIGKEKMNFDIDYRHTNVVRSPRAVPLLVLVREWGKYQEAAYQLTDVILLILKGIQPMACLQHGLEVQEMLDGIDDIELKEKFMRSFESVLDDLMHFMTLLDDLSSLLNPADKSSVALLDADCSNSIIGVYVRQCILEFKKLTFSQLSRIHHSLRDYFIGKDGKILLVIQQQQRSTDEETLLSRELDFSSKLRELVMLGGSGKSCDSPADYNSAARMLQKRAELGSEALKLAELHGAFEHNKEGIRALEEAICLAQRNDNSLILEHTLAWLLKMESFDPKDTLSMLKKFIKNAEALNLPSLGLWGRLHQVKTQISMSESPKMVLHNLLLSEVDYLSSYDEEGGWKFSLHLCTLTLLATTWEHYGYRLQALHYAQQVCHMMSCDQLPTSPEDRESLALSLVILARHLHQTGEGERSLLLLKNSMSKFRYTGLPFKILCKCDAELRFDQALDKKDFTSARRHLMVVQKFDPSEGEFRSAVLARYEGQLDKATKILTGILQSNEAKKSTKFLPWHISRSWQLLAEVNLDLCAPTSSLSDVMEALSVCRKHHLPLHSATLLLGKVLLQFDCALECMDAVKRTSLPTLSNGSLEERGLMHFLSAQASLIQAKDSFPLSRESILPVLSLTTEAASYFRQSSLCSLLLKNTLILQLHLHNYVGDEEEKDKILKLLLHLNQQLN